MSEIEDEIRRRMIAEQQQQLNGQQAGWPAQPQAGNGVPQPYGGDSGASDADQAILNRSASGQVAAQDPPAPQPWYQHQPQGSVQPPYQQQQQQQYPAYPPNYAANGHGQAFPQPRREGLLQRWRAKGGILGAIASILLFLAKVGAPILALLSKMKFLLVAGKFLLTGGSMLLSIWAYTVAFHRPLDFAIGIVLLIFIHECGHAFAAHLRGIKMGIMLFVPLMGAFVSVKGHGKDLEEDAFIGIMGPVVGTLASVACALIYFPTGNPFWLAVAQWGFFVNLFNLLPTPPLDGGWIAPLFSPKLLALGMIIAVVVGFLNPLIWLLLLMSLPRIIGGWKADPATQPYYQVTPIARLKYGVAYIGLAIFLALASTGAHSLMSSGRLPVM